MKIRKKLFYFSAAFFDNPYLAVLLNNESQKLLIDLPMKYFILFIFCSSMLFSGCSGEIEKYIEKTPNLSTRKIIAMRSGQIINGMSIEEVKKILGEPTFTEKIGKEKAENRWVYRLVKQGKQISDVYQPFSAFPQGIAYVIPLYYKPQEIRIDFCGEKVCRVQEILSF